jgi:hypothetical protein
MDARRTGPPGTVASLSLGADRRGCPPRKARAGRRLSNPTPSPARVPPRPPGEEARPRAAIGLGGAAAVSQWPERLSGSNGPAPPPGVPPRRTRRQRRRRRLRGPRRQRRLAESGVPRAAASAAR